MKTTIIQKLVSVPRFERYLIAAAGDEKRALKLYKANLRIAQAFHPVLGVFEIILRNCLNKALQIHFRDANWAINRQNLLTQRMRDAIKDVETRLRRKGGVVTNSKIIADQNLGFWTQQLQRSDYKQLSGSPIKAFKYLPKNINRHDISKRLDEIRVFRNRINHNEPICFSVDKISFSDAEKVYEYICEVMNWLDPDAKKLFYGIDHVEKEINRGKQI